MEFHRVKSVNTDARSKKRIRYASAKERSKNASADVYRAYDRRTGVTSAATRESFVHNPHREERAQKRQRKHHRPLEDSNSSNTGDGSSSLVSKGKQDDQDDGMAELDEMDSTTTFGSELDVAIDRNASEIFAGFHRKIWKLVRSLPEILHNADEIIDLHLAYIVSPALAPETPSPLPAQLGHETEQRAEFVVNLATTDILHLLAVLARDLRHEIHPYLHSKIIPRIVQDLLNPPPPPPDSGKQPIPLDVTIVEAAFRALSYIFRYDLHLVVTDMEAMRSFYGTTLGSRREIVRRLSAETFAPLIRKMKSQSARERHLRRVLRALAATGNDPTNRLLVRSQTDAVDGISQLVFQLVRGVPGKLHSQGGDTLRYLLTYLCGGGMSTESIEKLGNFDVLFDLASGVLASLCQHFDATTFVSVSQVLFSVVHEAVVTYLDNFKTEIREGLSVIPVLNGLRLMAQILSFRSGQLLQRHTNNDLNHMTEAISKASSGDFLNSLSKGHEEEILPLLCEVLAAFRNLDVVPVDKCIRSILNTDRKSVDSLYIRSVSIAMELLPRLKADSEWNSTASLLLESAGSIVEKDELRGIEIVFKVASTFHESARGSGTDFGLFVTQNEWKGAVYSSACGSLLDTILSNGEGESDKKQPDFPFLAVKVRCLPFLLMCQLLELKTTCMADQSNYKRAANWLLDILGMQNTQSSHDSVIVKSLALEGLSVISGTALDISNHQSYIRNSIRQARDFAAQFLLHHCKSVWAVRATASLIPTLAHFDLKLTEDPNSFFSCLVANLRSSNHFLRLYTLQILASFPLKPFVVDHTDLDLTRDLDEEESCRPSSDATDKKAGPVGPCDILQTLLLLEASPVRLEDERHLLVLIGKVEVLARTGRLPVIYAEAATNHMLGMMYVKFAPIWPVARTTIATLLTANEEVAWPLLEAKLKEVMDSAPEERVFQEMPTQKVGNDEFCGLHFRSCQEWESSEGKDVSLAGNVLFEVVNDSVPCHHTTDAETVMESIWKIAEMKQRIVAHHSRALVPVFFRFLHSQYFECHSDDQDALEIRLESVTQKERSLGLQGFVLQRRLKAFLRTFSAVDGPKQLVHHQKMEQIYRAFLGHQDPVIAELAFSCLMTFKLDYLQSSSHLIKEALQKGKLRHALLQLSENVERNNMESQQRRILVPVVSRILFGRVTARTGKSSKDSPAARRAAILSCLSVLCQDNEDLFAFLYLMTRSFLPMSAPREPVESLTPEKRNDVMNLLQAVTTADVGMLASPVIEGFLNLLESVISQWGHRSIQWVPVFMRIVVETCNLVAVNNSLESPCKEADTLRRGSIRTLVFQRLCELFSVFGSRVDFSPYALSLWTGLKPSLELLPKMAKGNGGCPALLTLMQTMSTEPALIALMVDQNEAVVAVIKCIARTSGQLVISASLSFLENLMIVEDENARFVGKSLVRKNAMLLMQQFTARLEGRDGDYSPESKPISTTKKSSPQSRSWKRELQILMKVSKLLPSDDDDEPQYREKSYFAFSLCSLLLPFLYQEHWVSDEDKTNILGILDGIVRYLTSEESLLLFFDLAGTLAPLKSRAGIVTLSIRQSIAMVIDRTAANAPDLRRISGVVVKLCSTHSKRVDEMDFGVVIPQLNALADDSAQGFWGTTRTSPSFDPSFLAPIINECFHLLYNDDGVITRASYHALRALILVTSSLSFKNDQQSLAWDKMAESSIIPLARSGLQSRYGQVRRHCILLVREITKSFSDRLSPNLCGDMLSLYNDENHDLDFFLSITHVQIHRRARAFQRLRKTLLLLEEGELSPMIGPPSISSVLLPLALHPIYECKSKTEEAFALDAIATVGAISRMLSWSKYNSTLWTLLTQFDRHPEQERYLVGAMCAIIDGFHFELVTKSEEPVIAASKTAVWRSLENRIIPKVEGLLIKESTDRSGSKVKTIRPTIVLALLKLFQKFPELFLEERMPRLLTVVCDTLRSKDSSARDVARNTLAKMVVSMDLKYLADVVRELALMLNEGYKLHVRAACVHSILLELLNAYEPPMADDVRLGSSAPAFDSCVAALMDLIQEDLFGEANERRESRETNVRYVKEAGGTKSIHSIEMICRLVVFIPSLVEAKSTSGVHCVVSPLLERLRLPSVDAKTIKKIREILMRAVVGFSNNKSVSLDELLPFVFATIRPFTGATILIESVMEDKGDEGLSTHAPIKVSGRRKTNANSGDKGAGRAVVATWQPSTLKTSSSAKEAMESKKEKRRQLLIVRDGANAPKLTGSMRHGKLDATNLKAMNDPAAITAIIFGLNLLNFSLKKMVLSTDEKTLSMMDPFISMLTTIVCHCSQTEVALLALKCLTLIFELHLDLPSTSGCSKSLGVQTLALLTSSGASLNKNQDLTQTCFRTLTYLINADSNSYSDRLTSPSSFQSQQGEHVLARNETLPLDPEQMKVLVALLRVSITESDQHNPAVGLVKALLSRRFISPEFYDLMESISKEVARSSKANLRQICSNLYIRFLLEYPMGEEKFDHQLKQVVANIRYEHEEGRLSSQVLLFALLEKLPQELLERHAQMFFLPLVLQLVNDESKICRERVTKCLVLLLTRSPVDLLQVFHEYCVRWSQQSNGPLKVASLQVFGLVVDTRDDFVRSNTLDRQWRQRLLENLREQSDADWESSYFSIVCIEKLSKTAANYLSDQPELLTCIIECMVHPHPWIKLSSSRIVCSIIASKSAISILEEQKGRLFEIVRNLSFQLSAGEAEQSEDISNLAIRTLSTALPIMSAHPNLCYVTTVTDDDSDEQERAKDPVFWLLRRLTQICKNKGTKRRLAIFRCYAAFAALNFSIIAPNLELILEGLHRAIVEAKNEEENQAASEKRHRKPPFTANGTGTEEEEVTEHGMAENVLRQFEDACSTPDEFLTAYAAVKRRARDKKLQRKTEQKAEAIQNPQAAAERKMKRNQHEKQRRKRRADEQRRARGGEKKRRSFR